MQTQLETYIQEEKKQLTDDLFPLREQLRPLFQPGGGWYCRIAYKLPFIFHPSVVDVETSSLEPSQGKLLTCGILSGSLIRCYILIDPAYEQRFRRMCTSQCLHLPRPIIAYSAQFEVKWLNITRDYFTDILCWGCAQGWYGWYDYRKKLTEASNYWGDDIRNSKVPRYWDNYWVRGFVSDLFEIAYHNIIDLFREARVAIGKGVGEIC